MFTDLNEKLYTYFANDDDDAVDGGDDSDDTGDDEAEA
jgi:hypothetical protein